MSDAVAKGFAENLTHYIEKSGLSQEELALRAEISRSQVSDLSNAKQIPRIDTLLKLAGTLGISPEDLLEGLEYEPAYRSGKFKVTRKKKK